MGGRKMNNRKTMRFFGIVLTLMLVIALLPGFSLAAFAESGGEGTVVGFGVGVAENLSATGGEGADVGVGAGAGSGEGSGVGAGAEGGANVGAGTGAEVDADAEAGTGADTDANTDANAGAGDDIDANAGDDTDANAGAGADTDANAGDDTAAIAGTDADTAANTGAAADADAETDATVKDATDELAPFGEEALSASAVINLNDRETTSGTGWIYDYGKREYIITGNVTFVGKVTNATKVLNIDMRPGASVDWAADYSGSMSDAWEGAVEVYGFTSSFNVVAGGSIRSNEAGGALYGSSKGVTINVKGGTVAAREGFAIYACGNIEISGGFVFAYGKNIDKGGDVIDCIGAYNLGGEGIVACWDDENGERRDEGSSVGLTVSEGATAVWHYSPILVSPFINYSFGNNQGFFLLEAPSLEIAKPVSRLSVFPTHAILANSIEYAAFEASFTKDGVDLDKIEWSASPEGVVAFGDSPAAVAAVATVAPAAAGRLVKIYALPPLKAKTAQIKAVYRDEDGVDYTATATVEILPDGIVQGTTIKVLEKEVKVNLLKEIGALVPVAITQQPPSAFSPSIKANGIQSFAAGSVVVGEIMLYTKNPATKKWTEEVPEFVARMYEKDDRYIRIDSTGINDLRAVKNVKVMVQSTNKDVPPIDAGTINITPWVTHPRVILKAGALNPVFPNRKAGLSMKSFEGDCKIVDVKATYKKDEGAVLWDKEAGTFSLGDLTLLKQLPNQKSPGSNMYMRKILVKMSAEVKIVGYKPLKMPVTVTVESSLPRLKLSSKSVLLFSGDTTDGAYATDWPAKIKLLPAAGKDIFENDYEIEKVEAVSGYNYANVSAEYKGGGVIDIRSDEWLGTSGKAMLAIYFKDATEALYLPLIVKSVGRTSDITLVPQVKAAAVNTGHTDNAPGNKIIDVPILLNTANYAASDWRIISASKGTVSEDGTVLEGAIKLTASNNGFSLSVIDQEKLASLATTKDASYTLKIGSDKVLNRERKPKTFTFGLIVTSKDPGFTVSFGKDKIDISDPGTFTTANVKLKGTSSKIVSVELFDSKAGAVPALPDGGGASSKFVVVENSIDGTSFNIAAAEGAKIAPKAKQKVSARITLQNGQTLTTWAVNEKTKKVTDKPIEVIAKQTIHKGVASCVSGNGNGNGNGSVVTLYKLAPLRGDTLKLELAASDGVRLGAALVNEASVKALAFKTGGFELERCGENEWTLAFKGGKAPTLKGNNALKASYAIKLELWAEGTYSIGADGKPVALTYKDPKTKKVTKTSPTLVKVKVNIK